MKLRQFIFIFLALIIYRSVIGQSAQYRFTRLDVTDGLSHNQIKTLFKDNSGFLWIGTISGLNRYDGYSIRVFMNDPNDSTSLISSDVNKVFEGPDGKIWIHTWSGINVYDPITEKFDRNSNAVLAKYAIPNGIIQNIHKDAKGNYWFVHATDGLFKYSPLTKHTVAGRYNANDPLSISSSPVSSITEDPSGKIWIIHANGVLEEMNPETLKVDFTTSKLNADLRNETLEYNVTSDRDGHLWIFVPNNNTGVFYFNPERKFWRHFDNTTSSPKLNTSIVRGIVQDDKGIIWIATDHGGINLIDKKDFSVRYVLENKQDEQSLSQNSINALYKDRDGIIWAGTFKKGISFYHPNINRFQLQRNQVANLNSLPYNDINAFAEDDKHNLWIGTNGGGLIYYNRATNQYKQYLHDPANPNSLSTNVIVSLFIDREKKLWIGTYFGGLNCFDGKRFIRYKHDIDDPASISDNSIWEIFEDSDKNLWIGTLSQGLDLFDRTKNKFYHYKLGAVNSIHASYITSFLEDEEKNLWIGTGYGIDQLDKKSGLFTHYLNQLDDETSLSNNSILTTLQDSRGFIWFGTHGGLNLFDKRTKKFRAFRQEDGLPHNSILTMLEDENHNLWLGTPHGISNAIIDYHTGVTDSIRIVFKNYDESDGLQGKQFNENAAIKTSRNELIFAGGNGFNIFRPEEIGINNKKPSVMLTDFQIFNKKVGIGEKIDDEIILKKAIDYTTNITLHHSQNVFSLEFSAVTHFHPEKNLYRYKMDGFDKDWTTRTGSDRSVTYTNLDPGDYVFKVIASNNDGIWNEVPAVLNITILPPFWKTKIAFLLYALGIVAALFGARWLILSNERMNFKIQQEREKAQRMHELDMMKIKFFTNVSHEFRTPLTLILTPLEKLLKNSTDPEQRNHFQLIHRNAKRLLNLVNQLLDFRKMEVQEIKFNPSEGDIVKFIREVFYSFSDLSEKKNIKFSFKSSVQHLETIFDQDKLEKILFNLLSNAFKFTPERGSVSVELNVQEEMEEKWLEISVKDTGIGIPIDKQEKVFERFFQNDLPKSMVNQGSGIGLSITREFVKIHGGTISVVSEPENGSCFTVMLPLTEIFHHVNADVVEAADHADEIFNFDYEHERKSRKPVLLLVEDNEDFRFYLKDNLKIHYSIIEAKNGRDGLQKAFASIPDLIVSDIMMPEMNGIDLCKKVKNDQRTSHIPVLLLTARTAEEQKIEGFESGANDYVTKPFSFEILQSRIKNLLLQREAFQKLFSKHIDVKAADVHITSMDEKLIKNAIKVVEDHLSDSEFSVEEFSKELGMSRVHLYKKLLSLTGKSPIEFIRTIRLQRAAQLLEKSQLSVSEIAYQVGFNNPKYFSKYFKDQFNMLPSVYQPKK